MPPNWVVSPGVLENKSPGGLVNKPPEMGIALGGKNLRPPGKTQPQINQVIPKKGDLIKTSSLITGFARE